MSVCACMRCHGIDRDKFTFTILKGNSQLQVVFNQNTPWLYERLYQIRE